MPLRGRNNLTGEKYFFVTTTAVGFIKAFSNEVACKILINNLKHYQKKYQFTILGYVIMPSHFHWIVEVNPEYGTISDIMRDIKTHSSKELTAYFSTNKEFIEKFRQEAKGKKDQHLKFWYDSFDDRVIRDDKMFWEKLNYIHRNPVEEGLVTKAEDYKYSSARNYAFEDHSVINVDIKQGGVCLW